MAVLSGGNWYSSHFADEGTKAQRGYDLLNSHKEPETWASFIDISVHLAAPEKWG